MQDAVARSDLSAVCQMGALLGSGCVGMRGDKAGEEAAYRTAIAADPQCVQQ